MQQRKRFSQTVTNTDNTEYGGEVVAIGLKHVLGFSLLSLVASRDKWKATSQRSNLVQTREYLIVRSPGRNFPEVTDINKSIAVWKDSKGSYKAVTRN